MWRTCFVKYLDEIIYYNIIVQTRISLQSKIITVHQNQKVVNNMF